MLDRHYNEYSQTIVDEKTLSKPIMIRWVQAFTHYLMDCDYNHGQRIVVKMAHTTYTHMDVQIKLTLEIISYHMRSWWIMTDDNWFAKTYSIQFHAKETSNQSNCVVSTLSNDDLTLTKWSFSATIHQTHSLAHSLPLTHSRHLTLIQRNVNSTQLNQSFNQIIHLFTNILI